MNDKTATEPTTAIEGLGLPVYLAYDAACAGAIYLGIDPNLFDPAELVAALPPATEDADRGKLVGGHKTGP